LIAILLFLALDGHLFIHHNLSSLIDYLRTTLRDFKKNFNDFGDGFIELLRRVNEELNNNNSKNDVKSNDKKDGTINPIDNENPSTNKNLNPPDNSITIENQKNQQLIESPTEDKSNEAKTLNSIDEINQPTFKPFQIDTSHKNVLIL
jgi:hypothetical protein